MESAYLILVLAGGFVFARTFAPSRTLIQLSTGYALAFWTVVVGAVWFQLVTVLWWLLTAGAWVIDLCFAWAADQGAAVLPHAWPFDFSRSDAAGAPLKLLFPPTKESLPWLSVATFWLSSLTPQLANVLLFKYVISERELTHKYAMIYGSDFERSVHNANMQGQELLITLRTGKVYAGLVFGTPDLGGKTSAGSGISILPVRSGYRDAKGRVEFTTDYRWLDDESADIGIDQIVTFVLTSEIVSFTNFDHDLYEEFHKHDEANNG
ncbi:hypothetical protein [Lentisalinibacter sediminis]|uniref:hypothetical protein n=1 Tax=Lentisalinibacter sediminis TaxID=2992237 RepID=UPI0038708A35